MHFELSFDEVMRYPSPLGSKIHSCAAYCPSCLSHSWHISPFVQFDDSNPPEAKWMQRL